MPGTPQYGGTNGVPELDMGQPGLARNGVTAKATFRVIQGDEQALVVPDGVPQQNVAFEQNLGFKNGSVVWTGSLRVDTPATLRTIFDEINAYKHGSLRVLGVLGAANPAIIKPTQITDSFGNLISDRARLRSATQTSPTQRITSNPLYNYHTTVRVVFELLG